MMETFQFCRVSAGAFAHKNVDSQNALNLNSQTKGSFNFPFSFGAHRVRLCQSNNVPKRCAAPGRREVEGHPLHRDFLSRFFKAPVQTRRNHGCVRSKPGGNAGAPLQTLRAPYCLSSLPIFIRMHNHLDDIGRKCDSM